MRYQSFCRCQLFFSWYPRAYQSPSSHPGTPALDPSPSLFHPDSSDQCLVSPLGIISHRVPVIQIHFVCYNSADQDGSLDFPVCYPWNDCFMAEVTVPMTLFYKPRICIFRTSPNLVIHASQSGSVTFVTIRFASNIHVSPVTRTNIPKTICASQK